LNNRTRSFDPQVVTGLRPMNRWRVRAIHNAVTYDVFLGYAESYEQSWPALGFDAITTVRLVDEFKVLALAKLPAMNPPSVATYAELVKFDNPTGYWRFQEPPTGTDVVFAPEVGGVSLTYDTNVGRTATPIVGDADIDYVSGTAYGARNTTKRFVSIEGTEFSSAPTLPPNGPGDAAGLNTMSFEMWFKTSDATPASTVYLALSPRTDGGTSAQWGLSLLTTGYIRATANNAAGTSYNTDSMSPIADNTWYHVAMTVQSAFTSLYINGVLQTPQAAFSSVFDVADVGAYLQIGNDTTTAGLQYFDEVAYYTYTLESARFVAHYEAGVSRGFPAQDPGARITAVLNESNSVAATSIRAGSRQMIPAFMSGQSPLDELRKAEIADSVDSILFVAKDGTITFLDDGHRSVSPWNTVQATFDDDGTDLAYRELTLDYSETFLHNTIRVARVGGEGSTSTDATSVSRYSERLMQVADLPLTTDSDVATIATSLLAKYKDPMERITSLGVFLYDTVTISQVLALELADRIRILRTHPAGGARIDQTAFVQRIQLSSRPGQPITVTLGVSPL
jgi:hypothetical protein